MQGMWRDHSETSDDSELTKAFPARHTTRNGITPVRPQDPQTLLTAKQQLRKEL
jgi:hypothetical protein